MNIFYASSFKSLRFLALLSFLTITLTSCLKGKSEEDPETSFVRIINASPTLATYNVYMDDVKTNMSGALPFGGTVNYKLYNKGPHTLKLTTASNPNAILSKNFSIAAATNYSCYLIDKDARLDWFIIEDKGDVFSATQAMIKFVNVSPDANALSLRIKDGAELADRKPYKSDTPYQKLDVKTISLELVDANTGNVLAVLNDLKLVEATFYTVFAKGYIQPGPNDHGISLQSIIAAQ